MTYTEGMSKVQKTTKPKRKRDDLLDIIQDPAARDDRIASAVLFVAVSVTAICVAWWYWAAMLHPQERFLNGVLSYAAVIALASAGLLGIVGAIQTLRRKISASSCIDLAAQIALPAFMVILVGSIIHVIREDSFGGLNDAWRSFVDFNRFELGSVSLSITTILTIMLIGLAIAGAVAKNNKK
jgi:hypothetical protein